MKLKLDENGNAVLHDGKPVYVNENAEETVFDAQQAFAKIAQLNGEAKQHREAKKAAEDKLAAFNGIDDPKKALDALSKQSDFEAKKLIDAGELDKVKAEMSKAFQSQLDEANKKSSDLENKLYEEVIGGNFARSKFVAEKMAIPADMVQSFFGKNFSVAEDGKIVATDSMGNQIFSSQADNVGNAAGFEEALSIIVEQYPNKNQILKSSGMSGAGEGQTSQGGSQPKRLTMNIEDKSKFINENGSEAYLALPE